MTQRVFHDEQLTLARVAVCDDLHAVAKLTVQDCRATGSAYYGNPNPADFDALVWITQMPHDLHLMSLATLMVERMGWTDCQYDGDNTSGGDVDEDTYGESWIALRKGNYNAIITTDATFYYRHAAGTELVRKMCDERGDVLLKPQVISIFRHIRGEEEEELTDGR